MKKSTILGVFAILISLALMSFDKASKDEKSVKLSEVSSTLSMYEGVSGQDFVADSIVYKVVEKEKYDKIFRESALIYATIVQIDGTIKAINSGTISPDTDFAIANVGFALKDIPGLKDRITKLQEQLQNLKPKDDFKGLEMKKAPKAADGISMAKNHLALSASMLPSITENIKGVAKKLEKK